MQARLSILFLGKKAKATSKEELPIYMRVTLNGQRIELTTQRTANASKWDPKQGKMKGSSKDVVSFNCYLDFLKNRVFDYQRELILEGKEVNILNLKNKIQGVSEQKRMLIPVFKQHNQQLETLVGLDYSKGTLVNFNTTLKHVTDFLQWKYNVSDIEIKLVDHAFIADFDFYLRSVVKTANNSTVKNIRNFGKIIRNCISNGWLLSNPFANYKGRMKEVIRDYLTETELNELHTKNFKNDRLSQVRDIFLFSCYTGLAYIDVQNLTPQHVGIGIDGEKWIFTYRQKTDVRSNIPLLPVAAGIVEKYKEHALCINKGSLLPVLSNQKMNAYLKEIASICNINKELTFHIARHTFATTVTLSNGVPIESVSKMLGHSSLKQTQHYAKILDKKVSHDMQSLKRKLVGDVVEDNIAPNVIAL